MAYSSPCTRAQTQFPISKLNSSIPVKPTGQGKSFKSFLSKSLLLTLCITFLPLFPSEVPDFMDNTIPAKLWEILRFMFIGIVVSYGFFSKRNVQKKEETLPPVDTTQSYASSMIHISSFFEDAFEIPNGSDEKIRIYSKSSHSSSTQKNDFEIPSMEVVVERGNMIDYEPMGLPIRSLRSGIINIERSDFSCGSDSRSGSKCSSSNSMRCGRREFGNLDPMNLKDTFDEAFFSSSPSIPCQSRSGSVEMREKVNNVPNPAHFWPLSEDETQYESLKSRSFRSTKSNSSNFSSFELLDFEIENPVEKRELSRSSFSSSTSPLTQINDTNRRGVGSSSEEVKGSSANHMKVERGENLSFSKESRLKSSNMNADSPKQNKIRARGMSVRTIRANRVTTEAMEVGGTCRNRVNKNGGEKIDDGFGKERARLINNGSQNLDNAYSLSGEKLSKYDEEAGKFPNVLLNDSDHQSGHKDSTFRVNLPNVLFNDSEHQSGRKDNTFRVSPNEDIGSETETDNHEVDKKADEFIAKFREQIKLQKTASMTRSRKNNI